MYNQHDGFTNQNRGVNKHKQSQDAMVNSRHDFCKKWYI